MNNMSSNASWLSLGSDVSVGDAPSFGGSRERNCAQDVHLNHQLDEVDWLPVPALLMLGVPAAAIILLTVFGNLLVLCFKARVGRTNTTLLVWNLGLSDFLVGVLVLPLGAVHLIGRKWVFGRLICRIWVAADVTFCTCSVVTICVISVDRYLAVTRPLRYKSVVTKVKVVGVMVLIWTFSSAILLTTVRWDHSDCVEEQVCFAGNEIRYLAHSVVFAFFLPASVTLTLYWRIYKLARNRQKALDRGFLMILGHNMNFLTNTISQNTTLRVHFGRNNGMVEHQRRVLRTHERIAKTLGVVSCSFLFCWLPFFCLYLANYQCSGCVPTVVIDIASWLGYCNSMLNPIIYSFTVKEFKKSALRAVLPAWRFAFHCLPVKVLPKPPDRVARVSRNQRVKARRTNPENGVRLVPNLLMVGGSGKGAPQRRLTAPNVLTFGAAKDKTEAKEQASLCDLRHTIAEEVLPSASSEDDHSSFDEATDPLVCSSLLVKSASGGIQSGTGEHFIKNTDGRTKHSSFRDPVTMPVARAFSVHTTALPTWVERRLKGGRLEKSGVDELANGAAEPSERAGGRRWRFGQRHSKSMECSAGVGERSSMPRSTTSITFRPRLCNPFRHDAARGTACTTTEAPVPAYNNMERRGLLSSLRRRRQLILRRVLFGSAAQRHRSLDLVEEKEELAVEGNGPSTLPSTPCPSATSSRRRRWSGVADDDEGVGGHSSSRQVRLRERFNRSSINGQDSFNHSSVTDQGSFNHSSVHDMNSFSHSSINDPGSFNNSTIKDNFNISSTNGQGSSDNNPDTVNKSPVNEQESSSNHSPSHWERSGIGAAGTEENQPLDFRLEPRLTTCCNGADVEESEPKGQGQTCT